MHNKIPGYSFAISFPFRIPLENLVLGKFRSLCLDKYCPCNCARLLTSSASAEVGPICWKKQSRTYLNIPNSKACSISMGQAPCTPCLLCSPKRILYRAFRMLCCDMFFSASSSLFAHNFAISPCFLGANVNVILSDKAVGTVQYRHNCLTFDVLDVYFPHIFSASSVSNFINGVCSTNSMSLYTLPL